MKSFLRSTLKLRERDISWKNKQLKVEKCKIQKVKNELTKEKKLINIERGQIKAQQKKLQKAKNKFVIFCKTENDICLLRDINTFVFFKIVLTLKYSVFFANPKS